MDELIIGEYPYIRSLTYELLGLSMITAAIVSGIYLYKFRQHNPKNFLISNTLLLLIFVILGLAFVLGGPTADGWTETTLITFCFAVFVMVAFRLLNINKATKEVSSDFRKNL